MSKKTILLIALIVLFVVSFLPFESTLIPPWEIQFLNTEGESVAGVNVKLSCHHNTYFQEDLCSEDSDSSQETKADGKVKFSRKTFRLSLMSRITRSLIAYPLIVAHGSVGRDAYVIVSTPMEYSSEIPITFAGEENTKITLRRSNFEK